MLILAIDPGPTESAFVLYGGKDIIHGKRPNEGLVESIRQAVQCTGAFAYVEHIAIEMVSSYGMPVGREVFETVLWIGRYLEAWWPGCSTLIYRHEVKMHLCHQTAKVNDAVIRQALIDRFGPEKRKAIGTKMEPGPLFGISGDVWQALAVAVTYADKHVVKEAA